MKQTNKLLKHLFVQKVCCEQNAEETWLGKRRFSTLKFAASKTQKKRGYGKDGIPRFCVAIDS
jgi:hypothetical protein